MSRGSQSEFDFDQYQEPRRVTTIAGGTWDRPKLDWAPLLADFALTPAVYQPKPPNQPILSTDSTERKNTPIWSTVFKNWPLALAALARHCKRGNDKHNPGEPIHWAREKSSDHEDCAARHLVDVHHFNAEIGEYEEACALVFRGFCILQLLEEKRLGRSPK